MKGYSTEYVGHAGTKLVVKRMLYRIPEKRHLLRSLVAVEGWMPKILWDCRRCGKTWQRKPGEKLRCIKAVTKVPK